METYVNNSPLVIRGVGVIDAQLNGEPNFIFRSYVLAIHLIYLLTFILCIFHSSMLKYATLA